ncbi:MAG: DUF58 domain-containing protein [Treponema sp.]|jgi:uncharacterized protein (DUF58 family)|nr:DUF58 domain-containing protein [Treponema sp.]
MDRRELLRRISSFPIVSSGLAEELLAGDYRSVFKGQGIEFDEARHYQAGDDARLIDWNVSARFGEPYVKMFREERELTVFILLDVSPSMHAGTAGPLSPYEQAALVLALVAFSAEEAGQRVGALFFDQGIGRIFPPRKGRRHVMGILGSAIAVTAGFRAEARGSDLAAALAGAGRLLKRRSLLVVISDFYAAGWEDPLGDLARKHDLVAVGISSPLDTEFPPIGLVPLEDPETGLRLHASSKSPAFLSAWSRWHEDRGKRLETVCRRSGAACLPLSAGEDAVTALKRFFGGRGESRRVPGRRSGPLPVRPPGSGGGTR